MLGQFRKGEAVDPPTFITSVAAVLARYSDDVIVRITDPRTGLATKTDWLPTIREICVECDRLAAHEGERKQRQDNLRQQIEEREAYEAIRAQPRLTMDELRAKYGPTWGIAPAPRQGGDLAGRDRRDRERTERAILNEYARLGREPVYSGGILLSPSLLATITPTPKRDETYRDTTTLYDDDVMDRLEAEMAKREQGA